jgi:hypothetical protein
MPKTTKHIKLYPANSVSGNKENFTAFQSSILSLFRSINWFNKSDPGKAPLKDKYPLGSFAAPGLNKNRLNKNTL